MVASSPFSSSLRVAVIGGGRMGGFHVKQYSAMKDVEFIGVVEPNEARAQAISQEYGCPYYLYPEDILGKVDAVSIVVPTTLHREVGDLFLENGVHCLIEKPLALTEEDCHHLIHKAAQKECLLMVGMIERFNPAFILLSEMLSSEKILALQSCRFNATGRRIVDTDVVSDLMVHDIDAVLSFLNQPVTAISAQGLKGEAHLDHVNALLQSANSCLVTLSASRLSVANHRTLTVLTNQGFYQLDYGKRTLRFSESSEDWVLAAEKKGSIESISQEIAVKQHDALFMELRHFIHCVRTNCKPLICGEKALKSLYLCQTIIEKAHSGT